jgi:hypothetical protein
MTHVSPTSHHGQIPQRELIVQEHKILPHSLQDCTKQSHFSKWLYTGSQYQYRAPQTGHLLSTKLLGSKRRLQNVKLQ